MNQNAQNSTSSAAPLTEDVLSASEQAAEDNAARLLDLTQRASAWERMVEEFKKSHGDKKLSQAVSFNFIQWSKGAYRLAVTGAEIFHWEEMQDGTPVAKSCPCLLVKVLDGDTAAVKALVGQQFRVALHWQMARTLLDHIGYGGERKVMSTIYEIVLETPELVTDRVTSILAYVRCDKDGNALKQDTKKGRRVIADAMTICAG